MLLPKPLDQIAAADIRSLVENKVKEGDRLEYKENLPKANDDERVKFLCTVASLANTLGGDIVIGIGERRDGNRKTGELLVKGLNEPGSTSTGLELRPARPTPQVKSHLDFVIE